MASLTPAPKLQCFDGSGNPLVGGKIYTYVAGTTTPLATYVDQAATATNTNPVILDSRGEASIWLAVSSYKLKLTDANDVEIWTVDNIAPEYVSVQEEATAAQIASLSSDINTIAKFLGKLVWDTTNNRMLRTNGSTASSPWYVVDGSGSVTPS